MKYLSHDVNPIEMKRGMDLAREKVLEFLDELAQPVEI
jgi:chaperonin GroEL (HSP60 family)